MKLSVSPVSIRDVPEIHPSQERNIIMSGHQPTLFHTRLVQKLCVSKDR